MAKHTQEQNIPQLYTEVQRLRSEVAEYITLGMDKQAALDIVRKGTCAGPTAWLLVENRIECSICKALVDVSKQGKLYCTAICWKNPKYKAEREKESAEKEAFYESYHEDWGDSD